MCANKSLADLVSAEVEYRNMKIILIPNLISTSRYDLVFKLKSFIGETKLWNELIGLRSQYGVPLTICSEGYLEEEKDMWQVPSANEYMPAEDDGEEPEAEEDESDYQSRKKSKIRVIE